MAWETPKTDWYGETTGGVYTGDRFNYTDFNRIKNNLVYLRELAVALYDEFAINDVGSDKTYKDYFYADEINAMEANLITINENSLNRSYGTPPTYAANGNTMDFEELNRLESATLDLYNRLSNQFDGRRMLTFCFGIKEVL